MILYAANLLLPEMGMASANRVKSLARGLCEFGEKVDVFCPFCDRKFPLSYLLAFLPASPRMLS